MHITGPVITLHLNQEQEKPLGGLQGLLWFGHHYLWLYPLTSSYLFMLQPTHLLLSPQTCQSLCWLLLVLRSTCPAVKFLSQAYVADTTYTEIPPSPLSLHSPACNTYLRIDTHIRVHTHTQHITSSKNLHSLFKLYQGKEFCWVLFTTVSARQSSSINICWTNKQT